MIDTSQPPAELLKQAHDLMEEAQADLTTASKINHEFQLNPDNWPKVPFGGNFSLRPTQDSPETQNLAIQATNKALSASDMAVTAVFKLCHHAIKTGENLNDINQIHQASALAAQAITIAKKARPWAFRWFSPQTTLCAKNKLLFNRNCIQHQIQELQQILDLE